MGLLLLLSAVPWSRLTGNRVKDFNLFEDLIPSVKSSSGVAPTVDVDPELEIFLAEEELRNNDGLPAEQTTPEAETPPREPAPFIAAEEAPRDNEGNVRLEFFNDTPLARFKAALTKGSARVAVLGDSFIEGDIFTQDLRRMFQDSYGGEGVGYVNMHTDFPGFRGSVRQSGEGWKMHDLRAFSERDSIRPLSGEYGKASATASAIYRGAQGKAHLDNWSRSRFLYLSPDSGTVTVTTDNGTQSFDLVPAGRVQCIEVAGTTSSFKIESDVEGLVGLGAYLDGPAGVQVDCMSIRGNSGIGQRRMSRPLALEMRNFTDYDLIILEYGINALSGEQTDYTPYATAMVRTVERIKDCYPLADIIILGIADRGAKEGSSVMSLPTCPAMVKAQRDVARRTASIFWDTREAMGGDGAVIDWRNRKLMNADYIHINHDGGKELARLFYTSLIKAVNE